MFTAGPSFGPQRAVPTGPQDRVFRAPTTLSGASSSESDPGQQPLSDLSLDSGTEELSRQCQPSVAGASQTNQQQPQAPSLNMSATREGLRPYSLNMSASSSQNVPHSLNMSVSGGSIGPAEAGISPSRAPLELQVPCTCCQTMCQLALSLHVRCPACDVPGATAMSLAKKERSDLGRRDMAVSTDDLKELTTKSARRREIQKRELQLLRLQVSPAL